MIIMRHVDQDHYIWTRIILIIGWGLTLAAAHWLTGIIYVVPILALLTFLVLCPFSIALSAILLSGYLDLFPATLPGTLKLLLVGLIWLAALGTLVIRLRRQVGASHAPISAPAITITEEEKASADGKLPDV